jgi:hypothetical protein
MSRHPLALQLALPIALACLALAAPSRARTLAVTDGDFAPADWSLEAIVSGTGSVDAVATLPAGGNPDAYRDLQMSLGTHPLDGVAAAQVYTPLLWDPAADGPIETLSYSFDFVALDGVPTRLGLLVEQNGEYYAHVPADLAANTSWQAYAGDQLTAVDFDPLIPFQSGHPDFGAGAPPLRFGVVTGQFRLFIDDEPGLHHGVDSWQLTLNPMHTLSLADGDFAEADWLVLPQVNGVGSVDAVATLPAGGNPGAYRDLQMSLGTGSFDGVAAAQIYTLATWDPAVDGSIGAIHCSVDFAAFDGVPTRLGFVIEQGDALYAHVPDPLAANTDWQTFSGRWLQAADFPPLLPFASGQPDFSIAGAPIRFGVATGQFALYIDDQTSLHHGVDNWQLTVNPPPAVLPLADGDFAESDWLVLTESGGSSLLIAAGTEAAGGNPGAYRDLLMSLGSSPGDAIVAGQLYLPFTWDPAADGPLETLAFACDFAAFDGNPTRLGALVEQDGVLYAATLATGATNTDWAPFSAGELRQADFAPLLPFQSGEPDFSLAGSPLRFGFATGQYAINAGGATSLHHGVDNWQLVLNGEIVLTAAPAAGPASALCLLGNYPNPFNPWTRIDFVTAGATRVSLAIHDLQGRRVRRLLAAEMRPAGPQSVIWDGGDERGRPLPSGVYFVRVVTADGEARGKLILLR